VICVWCRYGCQAYHDAEITGHPHRTTSQGETLSIKATELPKLLAPSLHTLPSQLQDEETRSRNAHVDLLVNRDSRDVLRLRHHLEKYMREFLDSYDLIHVRTPLLGASAGGATARPFMTAATEFPEIPLRLRIAPELFLKRLVVGGIQGVYEMGQAFRNEGINLPHSAMLKSNLPDTRH
jgi:lysyl-tRNA synthetase, class II